MNNPITLTAPQAVELHTTGRLTGYREKCEVELPKWNIDKRRDGKWDVYNGGEIVLTPTRDTDTTYAVKEPCIVIQHDGTIDDCIEYGELSFSAFPDRDTRAVTLPPEMLAELGNAGWKALTADEMPDWAVRQHARITDIKLIISDGELWWDMDLEKVG